MEGRKQQRRRRWTIYWCLVMPSAILASLAPTTSCTLLPFLKKRKVGMALTESSAARSPTSSTSTLRNTTLVFSWLIFSMAGAMRLHGPHHVAKKSTTTSLLPALASSVLNSSLLVTCLTILIEVVVCVRLISLSICCCVPPC